jgi:hypothetical protein
MTNKRLVGLLYRDGANLAGLLARSDAKQPGIPIESSR